MKTAIMYIESKSSISALDAVIGRVCFSKTGKTLNYRGREFQSLKGQGYRANYFDLENGDRYWISNCRRDGNDGLYRTTIYIDADVREEYWKIIRGMPERVNQESFISTGKHKANGQELKNWRANV